MKCLLSLFDVSLNWAQPYLDNGWAVCQIDLKFAEDLFWYDDPTLSKNIAEINREPPY